MKKIFVILLLVISAATAHAQFKAAMLQASGLTCAMCTKAINNSLDKLSFVQSVQPDIKNSAFKIAFKPGAPVNIDQLRKAVQDAGFSISTLKLTGVFSNVTVKNDEHTLINGNTFHFLNISNQILSGTKEITIVDKNFLSSKEFRRYSAATQMSCIQTGKAASCCKKDGIAENVRIYHATI